MQCLLCFRASVSISHCTVSIKEEDLLLSLGFRSTYLASLASAYRITNKYNHTSCLPKFLSQTPTNLIILSLLTQINHNRLVTEVFCKVFLLERQSDHASIEALHQKLSPHLIDIQKSFTSEGNHQGTKIAGGLIGAVAVAGAGYLAYDQWLKHQNKGDSEEAKLAFTKLHKVGKTSLLLLVAGTVCAYQLNIPIGTR